MADNDTSINPFEDAATQVMHADSQNTAVAIRNNVQFSVGKNPDQAAEYQHLAKYVGVPVETVQAQPDVIRQQAALQSMDADKITTSYPTLAKYLTDADKAAISHDDIAPLAAVESATKALPAVPAASQPPSFGDTLLDNAKSLASAPMDYLTGLGGAFNKAAGSLNIVLGAVPTVYDKVASVMTGKPTTAASDAWFKNMVDPLINAQTAFDPASNATFASKAFNTAGNLTGMLSQIMLTSGAGEAAAGANTVPQIVGQAVEHGAKSMAFPAITDSVDTGRKVYQETGDAGQAIRAAQMQYLTTTGNGVVPLSAPGGLAARLASGFASGAASGEASRQAMNLVLPTSMQQSFDPESMILSGLTGSMLGGVMGPHQEPDYHDAIRQTYIDASKADAAIQGGQSLQALGDLATASKTRTRDPEGFKSLVQNMTDDGNLQDVYIDANKFADVLNQSGVTINKLAETLPDVAAQFHEAVQTNGDIRIPVADYATHIAGGPVDAGILPNLKTDPAGMTYQEGQEYYQNQQAYMQAQAVKILADKGIDDAHQADAKAVHDQVLDQLNAAGRFPDSVNKSYAALMRDFYVTQADRAGMKPSEMFAKYPLKVTSDALTGSHFDQSKIQTDTPEFKDWFGDSKVVDGNGDPLVVYHGTNSDFAEFSKEKQGSNIAGHNGGFFFAKDPSISDRYAKSEGGNTMPVHVRIERPAPTYEEFINDKEFDGFQNSKIAVVRSPEQIKSAIGNRGTFDPNDANILHQAELGIDKVLTEASAQGHKREKAKLGDASSWLVHAAAENGLDIQGYKHSLDTSAVRHIRSEHGDAEKELARGQIPITDEDIKALPSILAQPDRVIFGYKNRNGLDAIVFQKSMPDGNVLYLEEVRNGRKELAAVTLRKHPATMNAETVISTLDLNAKRDGRDSHIIVEVPENESAIDGYNQGKRGSFNPDTGTIGLLKDADLSTFLHESGHFFLESMHDMASHPEANEGIKTDFDTLLKSFGEQGSTADERLASWSGKSLEEKRAGHEQFAEGFEKYLMEGKAPSMELQNLFSRFRSWLVHVYKSLSNLNVQLSPEVRGVMDRLLASDEAIKQAEQTRGYAQLTEAPEGVTPEQFAAYRNLGKEATEQAVNDMTSRSLRDMQWASNAKSKVMKGLQREAAGKRREIRDEVTKEVESQPVNQATKWLKKGEMTDSKGAEIKAVKGYKLNSDDLKSMFPETGLDNPDLSKLRGMTEEDGLHPDLVAEMFGFNSGADLVHSLIENDPKTQIEGMADQRMLERHGELVDPLSIERAAEAAIHNEARAKFMATGLKMLSKSPVPASQLAKAAQEAADAAVAVKKIGDLRPAQYSAAEARANRDAIKLAPKDPNGAVQSQRAALLNNRLFKATNDAVDMARKIVAYQKKFDKDSIRTKLDPDILDQIDALRERFDFRLNPTDSPTRKQVQLTQWIESQKNNGYAPVENPDMLNPEVRMHFKDMTVEQLRGFHDTIQSMEHIGRERKTVTIDGKRRDVAEIVAELNAKLIEHGDKFTDQQLAEKPRPGVDPLWQVALDRIASTLRGTVAEFKGQQFKANQYDNHDILGPFRHYIFDRIFNANYHKLDMLKGISDEARQKSEALLGKDWIKSISDVVENHNLMDNSLDTPVRRRITRGDMLGIARHVGNESNFDKLVSGMKWNPDDVWRFLHNNMTDKDWQAIQIEWDMMDKHWPEVEAMNRRLGNTSPERIEPRAFNTPFGEMRGGYAPVKYDPVRSRLGKRLADATSINPGEGLFDRGYYRADSTTNGSLNARTGYSDFIDLDFHSVERALHETIHDLAYREALIDVHKIITHPELRAQFNRSYGPEAYKSLNEWVGRIANAQVTEEKSSVLARIMSASRTAVVANGIAFRISTMEKHGGSAALKTSGYFSGGGMKYLTARMAAVSTNHTVEVEGAMQKFSEIRARALQQDRDFKQAVASIYEAESLHGKAERYGHAGVAWLDFLTAVPTAWAAYDRAIAEGIPKNRGGTGRPMTEDQAVAYANSIVREAHGSNIESSRSMLMSNPSELVKNLTILHGFMNNTLGQHMDMVDKFKTHGFSKPEVLARYMMAMIVPAIWAGFLSGEFDHDGEPWYSAAAKSIAGEYAGTVPMMRDAWSAVKGYRSAGLPPWMSALGAIAQPAHDVYDLSQGKELKHPIKDIGNAAGLAIPGLGQIGTTAQFLTDVATDAQHPNGVGDWVHGITAGSVVKH